MAGSLLDLIKLFIAFIKYPFAVFAFIDSTISRVNNILLTISRPFSYVFLTMGTFYTGTKNILKVILLPMKRKEFIRNLTWTTLKTTITTFVSKLMPLSSNSTEDIQQEATEYIKR
jgi:hypothetical protein